MIDMMMWSNNEKWQKSTFLPLIFFSCTCTLLLSVGMQKPNTQTITTSIINATCIAYQIFTYMPHRYRLANGNKFKRFSHHLFYNQCCFLPLFISLFLCFNRKHTLFPSSKAGLSYDILINDVLCAFTIKNKIPKFVKMKLISKCSEHIDIVCMLYMKNEESVWIVGSATAMEDTRRMKEKER